MIKKRSAVAAPPVTLPATPAPLFFFDEQRFAEDIARRNPVTVFKDALNAANIHFNSRFNEGEDARNLVKERAAFIDRILQYAWQRYEWDSGISLVAVGGYGRAELHPFSDVDILILLKRKSHKKYQSNIEQLLTFLWDIQLKISHSVRSISECTQEAKADVTVVTNLMETRTITGDESLRQTMLKKTGPRKIWNAKSFFAAKMEEQNERHRRHSYTEYNLEPNVKEAPGGLRDLQLINWVAQRHFRVNSRSKLVAEGFLTQEEYNFLRNGESFLWKVRYGIHTLAGRAEERLLFDYQKPLAEMFGFKDSEDRLGVEKFMQRYYQMVRALRELNDVLLQFLDEAILRKDKSEQVEQLNPRFVVRDGYVDTTDPEIFRRYPSAMLEIFCLLGENNQIGGIRASTIRELRNYRHLIDDDYRADPYNRQLFMRLMRVPGNLSLQLQRMNRYEILGRYLPEFGKIVGLTQHDLFHIYPVDVHTLQVVQNMRRLNRPESAERFPIASHIHKNLPKPELLYIAGLYHDIAKGRGGDHSKLGMRDVELFAERHGLSAQESELLSWLVSNHLLMSSVSQREDIADPEVIHSFATHVGDQIHLDYLYTLTVADINATNPKLWTEWRGMLMRQLYQETSRTLREGLEQKASRKEWARANREAALAELELQGITRDQAAAVWEDVDPEFFLREKASHIARFTQAIFANRNPDEPVILIKDVGVEVPVATQIFIHTKGLPNVFPITAATLDQLNLNIQDARLHTTGKERTFDTFYVLNDAGQPVGEESARLKRIETTLRKNLLQPVPSIFEISRRTSRQMKHFAMRTNAFISNEMDSPYTTLEVITPDRPGLLAHIGRIFMRFDLRLLSAKIGTLGERVEDTFYLVDQNYQQLTDTTLCRELSETICRELDERNREQRDKPLTEFPVSHGRA